jgi:hypothetical protein
MADKLSNLLDDLLDPATLASLTKKRAAKAKTDLSDLIPPPKLELLPPTAVILHLQENTCSRCNAVSILPLGIVAMHQLTRNGRKTGTNIGIPLTSPNEHPDLPREKDILRTQSMVCAVCVDLARTDPQPKAIPSPFPATRPGTTQWLEKYGYAKTNDIHDYEERIAHHDERIRRELEATDPIDPIVALNDLLHKENEE